MSDLPSLRNPYHPHGSFVSSRTLIRSQPIALNIDWLMVVKDTWYTSNSVLIIYLRQLHESIRKDTHLGIYLLYFESIVSHEEGHLGYGRHIWVYLYHLTNLNWLLNACHLKQLQENPLNLLTSNSGRIIEPIEDLLMDGLPRVYIHLLCFFLITNFSNICQFSRSKIIEELFRFLIHLMPF